MDRRELLGSFGAAAVGMMASGVFAAAAEDEKDHAHHHHMDKVHEDCLKACLECSMVCNMVAHHCLDMINAGHGDIKHHTRSHALAMDCSAFCTLSATMIARKSELMQFSCASCADACDACADECEKPDGDDAMKACAEKCRACQKTCHEMVQHMKASGTPND